MEILSCSKLKFRYNGSAEYTLHDVTFDAQPSQVVLVVGKTGSGKSTLLKLLKKEIAPAGELSGEIKINGKPQNDLSLLESTRTLAYVSQNPHTQTVTHNVSSELAFGLENLGTDSREILGKVGEMASYLGIEDIYDRPINKLSGGQKQLCCLCSALVQSPKILLLDEPAAQLDPIGASKLFSLLVRLNSELGTTLVIAEHRPREIFPYCDKIVFLDKGSAKCYDKQSFIAAAADDPDLQGYIPPCTKALLPLGKTALFVKDAKNIIEKNFSVKPGKPLHKTGDTDAPVVFKAKDLYFRYSPKGKDVVNCLDVKVKKGEFFAAVGSNGCGKTTMLKLFCGILRPWQGKITLNGKNIRSYKGNTLYRENIAYMPQDPFEMFVSPTVKQEFENTCKLMGQTNTLDELVRIFEIDHLLDMNPYDLSGGEIQKCALVKLLLTKPEILFLDEPGKGLDPVAKARLGTTLSRMCQNGKTVVIATHDLDFAAEYAHTCALFFDGKIHSKTWAKEFFSNNNFYTTDASRIARSVFPGVITTGELEKAVKEGEGK